MGQRNETEVGSNYQRLIVGCPQSHFYVRLSPRLLPLSTLVIALKNSCSKQSGEPVIIQKPYNGFLLFSLFIKSCLVHRQKVSLYPNLYVLVNSVVLYDEAYQQGNNMMIHHSSDPKKTYH